MPKKIDSKTVPVDATARLRIAVKRLGGATKAIECLLLAKSPYNMAFSEKTLRRWLLGNNNERFPKKAAIALRLLETAVIPASPPKLSHLRYAVIPNPASLPLVLLRSFEVEPEKNPESAPLQPLPCDQELHVGLGLSLERRAQPPNTEPPDLLRRLLQREIDLAIAPEKTAQSLVDGGRIELLFRLARLPTLLIKVGDDRGPRQARVFWPRDLPNSASKGQRLRRYLKMHGAHVIKSPFLDDQPPEEVAAKMIKSWKRDQHAFLFGPTELLTSVYQALGLDQSVDGCYRFEKNKKLTGVTSWCLYARPKSIEIGSAALLVEAIRALTPSLTPPRLSRWAATKPDEVMREAGLLVEQMGGLPILQFERLCDEWTFECDQFSAPLGAAFAAAVCRPQLVLSS